MYSQSFSSGLIVVALLVALSIATTSAAAEQNIDRPEALLLWKPKLDAWHVSARSLKGVAAATAQARTERCYTICPTCVCVQHRRHLTAVPVRAEPAMQDVLKAQKTPSVPHTGQSTLAAAVSSRNCCHNLGDAGSTH